ncbi:DUF7009 family protein [Dyadobacter sp. NIV53]|uniref:DUF7009 family protein n=1 Tax=Dyadobacter sp. NIV53 TaxID=2861765 RepID=UPI001C876155|nr:hypothetical protein [Dyadobacter sp. NIV53]
MKIRIHGNSVRVRLSKTEVELLSDQGHLEECTSFGSTHFSYALTQSIEVNELTATFADNQITMLVPATFLEDWAINNIVGFEANMPINDTEFLYLLLEKDFKCLDNTTEDQSDNFENPNKTC